MSSRFDNLGQGQRLLNQRTWPEAECAMKDMLGGTVTIRLIVKIAMLAVAVATVVVVVVITIITIQKHSLDEDGYRIGFMTLTIAVLLPQQQNTATMA